MLFRAHACKFQTPFKLIVSSYEIPTWSLQRNIFAAIFFAYQTCLEAITFGGLFRKLSLIRNKCGLINNTARGYLGNPSGDVKSKLQLVNL